MGRAVAVLLFLASMPQASAYVQTVSSGGAPVHWSGNPKLQLAGNPDNASGLDGGRVYSSIVNSLQRWKYASGGRVDFDYWQGTDRSVYEPNSDYNGLSSIYFASNSQTNSQLSANVLGLTQVWYSTQTGEVLESDVVLNDRDFRFTTDPRDTSGFGSGAGSSVGRKAVFIENVLTHELGHVLGLSHSGGLQSTMLFMESPEQAHLGCDEAVAIRALYPAGDAGIRGAIEGSVTSESGAPVFGAHVVAISRRRGTVLATGITNRAGHYRIAALEPGAYFLMVEPYFAGQSALPSYYAGMNSSICPGGVNFGRNVLLDSSTRPQTIQVESGSSAKAPTIQARCSSGGGAALRSFAAGVTGTMRTSSEPVAYDGTRDGGGFGIADRFSVSKVTSYQLRSVSGHLEIHAMGYSLYSPIHPSLSLADSDGKPVTSARIQEAVYEGDSGYVNHDSVLVVDALPPGDYVLQVEATAMDASQYPAGPVSIDSVPFLVVTGSVNEAAPALSAQLPVNGRCVMEEHFSSYVSPGGNPPRHSTSTEADSVGFCGSIQKSDDDSGPSPGAMAGWILPWACMALFVQLAKALARGSFTRVGEPSSPRPQRAAYLKLARHADQS